MPPQRRKIVPPNTTSQSRKKVAGTNRKTTSPEAADADSAVQADTAAPAGPTAPDAAAVPETAAATEPADATAVSLDKDDTTPADSTPAESTPVAAESEEPEPVDTAADSPRGPLRRIGWVPALVVAFVALALVVFAVVAALKPGTGNDNQAWVDQGATSEVTRSATDALTAIYGYSYDTVDDQFAGVDAFLTEKMAQEFDSQSETIKSSARQTQAATQVDMMDIGVSRLESDNAELIIDMNVSTTQQGVARGNVVLPLIVNMEKVDGKWLLSAIDPR